MQTPSRHTPAPTPLNVLLFPFAGGDTRAYREWRDQGRLRFVPVRLPGRESRFAQPRFRRMEDLLALLVDEMTPVLTGPYALFGHSMGAGIAHAFALHMDRMGMAPPHWLAVSARRPPHIATGRPCATLDDDGLKREIMALGGTPAGVLDHPELAALLLPILRDDLALDESYRSDIGAPCPVIAFSGAADSLAPPSQVAGWHRVAPHGFCHHVVPGDHFYLTTPAGRTSVITALDTFSQGIRGPIQPVPDTELAPPGGLGL